ncbi:hypothetical protein EG328_009817 [Venturia inaequalis]|uniref:Uncharacterized protein n=1 Tax=Venturia inaequalis TaxID=5025 RepID=A0A8H3UAT4_VENIN|nr:hypothetical protein EG328_009817 [Venturia inaequalis]KAE9974602.1 hypothetical protein EG327_008725 [Venturia inaequalis]RDI83353.1 UPF0648 protein [Venturia inaequalis]
MVHLFGEALAESGPKALSAPQVIEQKPVEPVKLNQFRMQETLNLRLQSLSLSKLPPEAQLAIFSYTL